MTNDEATAMIEEIAAKLGAHFDAVQIMVSWNEEALTKCGNRYARQGMAHELISRDVAQVHANEIGEKLSPPDDDAESWKKA